MNLAEPDFFKHKLLLIQKHVLPMLGIITMPSVLQVRRLAETFNLRRTVKYQELEMPGTAKEGQVWFSMQLMMHSYYFCPFKQIRKGTRIWKRCELVLSASSLIENEARSDYLEALEPGEVFSIGYAQLLELMNEYPEIEKRIKYLAINNERYYHRRAQLLNHPPLQRVQFFEEENQLFCNIASKEVKGMHVGLTRQGYNLQLKKLKQM